MTPAHQAKTKTIEVEQLIQSHTERLNSTNLFLEVYLVDSNRFRDLAVELAQTGLGSSDILLAH